MGSLVSDIFGGGGAPSAPDPTATATAQQRINQVNQVSPFGSLTYSQTGTNPDGTPQTTATTSLSPQEQALFNQQMGTASGLGGAESGLVGQIDHNAVNGNPAIDPSNLAREFGRTQGAAFDKNMSFLAPQEQQQTGQLEDKLAAQGITMDSNPTAYKNAMELNNNNQTFANQQAFDSSFQNGLQGENQLFNQGITAENNPISQLSSVMGMASPNAPTFSQLPQVDLSGLVQQNYQSQLASYNNQQQGLFGLGGAGLMAYGLGGSGAATTAAAPLMFA